MFFTNLFKQPILNSETTVNWYLFLYVFAFQYFFVQSAHHMLSQVQIYKKITKFALLFFMGLQIVFFY